MKVEFDSPFVYQNEAGTQYMFIEVFEQEAWAILGLSPEEREQNLCPIVHHFFNDLEEAIDGWLMGLYLYENGLVTDDDEVTEDEIQDGFDADPTVSDRRENLRGILRPAGRDL